jgi:hypothetical protein
MSRVLISAAVLAFLFAVLPECGSRQLQHQGDELEQSQGGEAGQPASISSRIGLHTAFVRMAPAKRRALLEIMQPLAGRVIRDTFMWNDIEPQKGEFRWAKADAMVDDVLDAGLDILAILTAAPDWAGGRNVPAGAYPPASPEDYGRFVEAFVKRYKGRIKYYELWNEPNVVRFWGGQKAEPEDFVALLQAGYRAGKKADPDAVFVMGGLTRILVDREFIREVLTTGGLEACDVVAIHLYPDDVETFGRQVDFFLKGLAKLGVDKPVWITETGWPSKELDMSAYMERLAQKGITREKFLESVALRYYVGNVFKFSEDEFDRSRDSAARKEELAGFGLTEDALLEIIKSCAVDRMRDQADALRKLSAFLDRTPRVEKVFWYQFCDGFDSPIKEGNFGIVDVGGKPKESFNLMAGRPPK